MIAVPRSATNSAHVQPMPDEGIDYTISLEDYDRATELLAIADVYMANGQTGDAHHALLTAMHLLRIGD